MNRRADRRLREVAPWGNALGEISGTENLYLQWK